MGVALLFKIGHGLKRGQVPSAVAGLLPTNVGEHRLQEAVGHAIKKKILHWAKEKPWLILTEKRRSDVVANLNAVGDWSFRFSRNVGIHSYPSTFVHAIPANLIMSLGLGANSWSTHSGVLGRLRSRRSSMAEVP